ncbi:hypothetical protein RZS08_26380, partial [Arthrospira platensis SPKY1]|nr:hypothetical protein [Arthrospira platensis SPKY1]
PGLLNCYQTSLSLDGSGSSAGPSLVYAWTTANGLILEGATTPTPVAGQAGLYLLTVTDTVNQCRSTDSVWVNEDFEIPQADAGPPATLTCAFPEAQLNGSGSQGPAFTYAWTSQDGLILSGEQTLTPVVAAAGLYQLLVTN